MLLIEGILKDFEEANLACLGSSIDDFITKMVKKNGNLGSYFQCIYGLKSGGGGSKMGKFG